MTRIVIELAKTQKEMRQRSARPDVDTHLALALAKAHSESRGSNAVAKAVRPKELPGKPELRVVQRPKRITGFRISNKVMLAYLVGFLALFAAIVMRAEMAATQLNLNRLNSQLTSLQTQHQRLEVELSSLEAPNRIVSYAETHLGMVYPSQVGYLGVTSQTSSNQTSQIPLTQQVLSAPNTLFAPAGEAGGGAPSGPPAPSPATASSKAVNGTVSQVKSPVVKSAGKSG